MTITFPPALNQRGSQEIEGELEVLAGAVPPAMSGSVFGVAPVGGAVTNTPFLNGPPLFYRIDFSGGAASILTRRGVGLSGAAEAGARAEGEAWAFKDFGITRLSPKLGARDFSNTALLPIRLRSGATGLLATYDAGRPHHLDPATLTLLAPLGEQAWWRANLLMDRPFKQVFSTAHPAFDAERDELFVVNHGRSLAALQQRLFDFVNDWLPWSPLSEPPLRVGPFGAALGGARAVLGGLAALPAVVLDAESRIARLVAALSRRGVQLLGAEGDEALSRGVFGVLQDRVALLEWLLGFAEMLTEFSKDGPVPDEHPATPFTYLLRWKKDGTRERFELRHKGQPVQVMESAHQMAVTRDYVVFVDAAFKMELDGITSIPESVPASLVATFRREVSRAQPSAARFYFVKRAELDRADLPDNDHRSFAAKVVEVQSLEVPGEVVHFHADHSPDAEGNVVLYAIHQRAMDGAEFVLRGDRRWDHGVIPDEVLGSFPASMSANAVGRYAVDVPNERVAAQKVISDPETTWALGLSTGPGINTGVAPGETLTDLYVYSPGLVPDQLTELIYALYDKYPGRDPAQLERLLARGGSPSLLLRVDLSRMEIAEHFSLAPDQQLVSPQFVPTAEGDGYVVCNVFSGDDSIAQGSRAREVWIFAAKSLASGPVCRLWHPQLDWGYTLHTAWLPTVEPTTEGGLVTPEEDLGAWLNDPEVRGFFERHLKAREAEGEAKGGAVRA